MSAKLTLSNISKSFPGVTALKEVSFSIAAGEIHAVVGANGAGKSTLIKIISGVYPPDAGEMNLDGKPFRPRSPSEALARGVSTIYQERNCLPGRSVMFNIMLGREPVLAGGRLDFAAMRRRSQEALSALHADHIPLTAPAESLSVGERQVVEIARALCRDSSLLIMDEPTAALNAREREALFELMRGLRLKGISIIYISHRLDEIFKMADRVTVLRDGERVLTAPTVELGADQLIRAMIGRDLSGAFPEKNRDWGEVILSVEGLSSAGSFRDISFDLRRGEVLGITGLEGSGKEELGRALFGALAVDRGEVRIAGERARLNTADLIRKGIAYLPADRKIEGVIAELGVKRNISLPLLDRLSTRLGRIRGGKEAELAGEWIEKLDIKTPSLNQLCENLSGGNQQKVALAKWLAAEARVLILAHPTQEIDVGVKFELYRLIVDLSRQGAAVVLISADLSEILGLCHRIMVMRDGKLAAFIPAEGADKEAILRYTLGGEKELSIHGKA